MLDRIGPDPRRWAVIAISALALLVALPCASLGWRHAGSLGLRWDRWSGTILAVAPDSPAGLAGVRAGDRIVSSSISIADRLALIAPPPNRGFSFDVERGNAKLHVAMRSLRVHSPYPQVWRLLIATEILTYAAFVVVGTGLLLMRPGPMTLALYAFCIGAGPLDALTPFYTSVSPEVFAPGFVICRTFLSGFSALPLMIFALRFPLDSTSGWRRTLQGPIVALVFLGLAYYASLAVLLLTTFVPAYRLLDDVPALLAFAVATVLVAASYYEHRGPERQRLKIAVAGMLLGFFVTAFDYVPGVAPIVFPIVNTLSLVMPVALAYAVLKHRVFDIQYFVNRALVYALTASILVIAVGFVEWFISELIAEQHLALSLTAAASIGIGVLISKLHQRGEQLLDRMVFRARYRAGAYFARLGRSLGEADEPATIGEALVADACEELGLTSAALFALDATTQAYLRANSRGWPATCANELAHDDKLVRALRSELEFVRTADLRWHHDGLPEGHAQPTLAVPVRIGTNLLALVLYGPHENGADLDPDEARLLLRLADAAAIAYVRVRARERDGELAELRAQLAGRSLAPSG